MIPKLASNLLHFNLQRVAAAVQTQTTQTLRNVLQFQPQAQAQAQAQSVAPSTTATSLGWNAANGAAGTGAGPGGAKFNAGSGFYNAFQVSRFPFGRCSDIVSHPSHIPQSRSLVAMSSDV